MLSQFSFSNFKSYKNDTTFDFQAESIPEFADSLITDDKAIALLPVSAVYGPNGGGKTNLLKAFACLISIVVKPIYDLDKTRVALVIQQAISAQPFLLDTESRDNPTEFEVYFRTEGNEYRYYLAVLNGEIDSEYLYWRAIGGKRTGTVFTREGSDIELGASIKKNSINTDVNPKMPYLSFLAINYNIPVI
ncbi:MAG: AAA family ATPase, partial [Clostridiales bacterium]|nr:AAA family ATPase [Candidatus Crickella merdequi]